MAWAGCNASGNGGLGIEHYIVGGLLAGILCGQWFVVLLLMMPLGTIFFVWFLVTYEDVILEKYND